MRFRRLLPFLVASLLAESAQSAVEDWFIDKAITYQQDADNTQPTTPVAWTVEVAVETTNEGDADSVSISRNGSPVSHDFEFEDGEWIFEKDYESEAEMN